MGTISFTVEVPLCNLLTSICNFVPCDQIVQRANNNNETSPINTHVRNLGMPGFTKDADAFLYFQIYCDQDQWIMYKVSCHDLIRFIRLCQGAQKQDHTGLSMVQAVNGHSK